MRRVSLAGVLVGAVGVIAAVATNVPYWNWYGFPGNYTAASMFTQIVGFIAVGLVVARVIASGSELRVSARV